MALLDTCVWHAFSANGYLDEFWAVFFSKCSLRKLFGARVHGHRPYVIQYNIRRLAGIPAIGLTPLSEVCRAAPLVDVRPGNWPAERCTCRKIGAPIPLGSDTVFAPTSSSPPRLCCSCLWWNKLWPENTNREHGFNYHTRGVRCRRNNAGNATETFYNEIAKQI